LRGDSKVRFFFRITLQDFACADSLKNRKRGMAKNQLIIRLATVTRGPSNAGNLKPCVENLNASAFLQIGPTRTQWKKKAEINTTIQEVRIALWD
jgi:hypothetical protein